MYLLFSILVGFKTKTHVMLMIRDNIISGLLANNVSNTKLKHRHSCCQEDCDDIDRAYSMLEY